MLNAGQEQPKNVLKIFAKYVKILILKIFEKKKSTFLSIQGRKQGGGATLPLLFPPPPKKKKKTFFIIYMVFMLKKYRIDNFGTIEYFGYSLIFFNYLSNIIILSGVYPVTSSKKI